MRQLLWNKLGATCVSFNYPNLVIRADQDWNCPLSLSPPIQFAGWVVIQLKYIKAIFRHILGHFLVKKSIESAPSTAAFIRFRVAF